MDFTRYASLKDRTVVITGGASGIGAAFVRAFAENGARVAFLDVQQEAGAALVDALGPGAGKPLFIACDLTDIDALRAALDAVRTTLGPATVLINNAASDQRHDFATMSPAEFDHAIAVNFRHVFFAAQAIVPADARARPRFDRQHVFRLVDARYSVTRGLCLRQGRDCRLHQHARPSGR